jgi:transposase
VGAQELSTLLWRERETLELLLFKLEEEQLLLTAGRNRWLPHATREVEQVLARLRESGLERAVAVSALAEEYGIAEEATLKQIVEAAPTPAWTDVFASHLAALEGLAAEIAEVRDANVAYLRAAARSTSDALAGIDLDAGTYDASGSARQHDGARLFQADA